MIQELTPGTPSPFESIRRVDDHFVEITDMIEIGKGGKRSEENEEK